MGATIFLISRKTPHRYISKRDFSLPSPHLKKLEITGENPLIFPALTAAKPTGEATSEKLPECSINTIKNYSLYQEAAQETTNDNKNVIKRNKKERLALKANSLFSAL